MSEFTVEPIGDHISILGESPHWDERNNLLLYIDWVNGDICKLNINTGVTEIVHLPDYVTVAIPYEYSDHILVTLRNKILKYNWNDKTYEIIAMIGDNEKEVFNDGKIDANGCLWIGAILLKDTELTETVDTGGCLYRYDGHNLTKEAEGFHMPNGMVWSNDYTKFYFNDMGVRKVYVFDYDMNKGMISNKKVLIDCVDHHEFDNGSIDGMTIDINGNLWISVFPLSRVVMINTEKGRIENVIHIPAPETTSLNFGGPNSDELFVTTAKWRISDNEKIKYPDSGRIFRVKSNLEWFRAAHRSKRFKPL